MPLAALFRHLGKMTADKVFAPGSAEVSSVCERIQDETTLKKVPALPLSIYAIYAICNILYVYVLSKSYSIYLFCTNVATMLCYRYKTHFIFI